MDSRGLTMTPELRLRDEELKVSLSCIRKFFFPGMCCMMRSTHIMLEPKMQAKVQLEKRSSLLLFSICYLFRSRMS